MRKLLLYVILFISQDGLAAQDFTEVKIKSLYLRFDSKADENLKANQETYKKNIRSLKALTESKQCDPKVGDYKSTPSTYYYYGCFIYLNGTQFIIFSKHNHNHAYTIQDTQIKP